MNGTVLTANSWLPHAALTLGVLVAGGIAGLLASLVLLRYADTRWAGRLLGVRTANAGNNDRSPAVENGSTSADVFGQEHVAAGSAEAGSNANNPEPLDHLAADFAVHAQAVRAQVSRYADLLADGDAVLRARLRRIEDVRSTGTPGGTSGGAW